MFLVIHNRGDANFRPRLFSILINYIQFLFDNSKEHKTTDYLILLLFIASVGATIATFNYM